MSKATAVMFFIPLTVGGLAIAFGDHAIVEIKKAGIPPFHQGGLATCSVAGPPPPQGLMLTWSTLSPAFWWGFWLVFGGGGLLLLFQKSARPVWSCILFWSIVVTVPGMWLGYFLLVNVGFHD